MTRDEARAKCIETMAAAMFTCYRSYNDETQKMMWVMAKSDLEHKAARALASLHGFATVNLPEATPEMIEAGRAANLEKYPNTGLYQRVWRAMSATGDLTKTLETNP